MKVLDLFSGVGGFSLGLEAAGMETVALSGFIKNMEEVKEKIGDQSYPISAFINMAKDFKGVWLEVLADKVNE